MNAVEIEEAVSELASKPFDSKEFPFEFLAAFDAKDTSLKRLRKGDSNASDIAGGILWRNNIHIAVVPFGGVGDAFAALRASSKTINAKAKFVLATDGQWVEAEDLLSGETIADDYANLARHFGFFLPLAGISTVREIKNNPIDIKATGRLNRLYLELLKDNPKWAASERRPELNHFMARLIFCFFAEDTGLFRDGLFTATLNKMSHAGHGVGDEQWGNAHEVLAELFKAMDTPVKHNGNFDDRYRKAAGIRPWADVFPYVNGGLFAGSSECPRFSRIARTYLLRAGELNWKEINPDIFGSMIQAVADDEERGALGMHYTSVPNILKVLNPLFLDDLREHLEEAGDNSRKLLNLRNRIARIRVFDPACGSGNFLVIAYKEMRALEAEINKRRGELDRKTDIPLTNFRGIELRDFPAEIARLALIIAEYQCDVLYRGQKEALVEFLPLNSQNWITCGNALRLDWLSICPPTGTGVKVRGDDLFETPLDQSEIDFENAGGETYICGNPPFKGARKQSVEQKNDMERIFGGGNAFKDCDYVTGWFVKAAEYSQASPVSFAFVATNSISRGEQVAHLWGRLFSFGIEIFFAHQQFRWSNSATQNAGVWCVVIGASNLPHQTHAIFNNDLKKEVDSISPYLVAGEQSFIEKAKTPLNRSLPKLVSGNMARDGGNLILTEEEMLRLLERAPQARKFLRPLIGTTEIKQGTRRWAVWIKDDEIDEALRISELSERVEAVRDFRNESNAKTTKAYASVSHRFAQRCHEERNSIVLPKNTVDGLDYLTPNFVKSDVITTDLAFVSYTDNLWVLGLLSSTLHRVWAEAISGGLGSGVRYSSELTYNAFPLPKLIDGDKVELARCAENILLARERYFPATLAELYDPARIDIEFPDLRLAHEENDEVFERVYIGRLFRNDTERLEKLFELYTKMTGKKAAS